MFRDEITYILHTSYIVLDMCNLHVLTSSKT